MDRGGDRGRFYKHYLEREKPIRFVIRLKGRYLLHKGKRKNCFDIAHCLPTPHETVLIIYEEGKEKRRKVQYNAIPVKLPTHSHKLYFCCRKGIWDKTYDVVNKLCG